MTRSQRGTEEKVSRVHARSLGPEAWEMITQLFVAGQYPELKKMVERTMILAPEGNIDAVSLLEEIRGSQELESSRKFP
jgi:hypothetical protein